MAAEEVVGVAISMVEAVGAVVEVVIHDQSQLKS